MTGQLLVDHSAWSRLAHRSLRADRALEVFDWVERGLICVCLPFLLEAGYSARDASEHAQVTDRLLRLPRVLIDPQSEARALSAQDDLVGAAHHRLKPIDLIIAALADRHDLGVLHYDADYDVIRDRTDLDFESVWLAPSGTL